MMVLEISMDLLQPHMVQAIIDQGVARHDMRLVLLSGARMVLFALVGLVGGMGCTFYAVLAAQGGGADLRRALFAKVQSLSFANLDQWETGTLVTRLTNDVTQFQEVVMILLRMTVRAPFLLVGSLIMATLTSPRLSVVFVVLMPLLLGFLVWIVNKMYPVFSQVQARLDRVNTVMQENLSGVRVVKAFSRSKYEIDRFGTANEALTERNILAARLASLTMPSVMLCMNIGVVVVLWYGGKLVVTGDLSVGKVIAFVNYLTQALMSLMMTSMLAIRLSRSEASSERIEELLNATASVVDSAEPANQGLCAGRVAFEDVSFGYGDSDSPVLSGVSFVAEPGQTVAILGATGSGKSSLVNLIPRFYDVTAGRVTLDGEDVRKIPQEVLRRDVGIALQESFLFSSTIRDNIAYGMPELTDEEVRDAALAAQADEFIRLLPEAYDSPVEQRGANFSGGQRQRLAIARALAPKPKVLILDDSTSAVDLRTEALIGEALKERGPTKFLVTTRISGVQGADRILVLDDGRLVAQGTHSELMNSSHVYREIFESQQGAATVDELGE